MSHVLSCHCFRFLLLFFRSSLGYLKDNNGQAHSVDSDIFYIGINVLRVPSFTLKPLFLKVVSNCGAQDNGTFVQSRRQQHVICVQTSKRTSFEQLFHLDYFTLN